jgi:HTH-type transcriptional regulator/antitoxin HipB
MIYYQAAFAKWIGVSRPWVIAIERGHPRAAPGLVLRAMDAPDIHLDASIAESNRRPPSAADIDAIVTKAKKRRS